MPRNKVKLAFIENNSSRKVSYRKRQKGFLTKTRELNTLCDVEIASVIYSPYQNEPIIFPNNDVVTNTFTTFRELSRLEQSKNMMTQENFTKQRIQKMEEKLEKVRKENRVREFTNKMYEMLNGEDIPNGIHVYDLNDLSYVINQNLKEVCEAIKALSTPVLTDVSMPINNHQNNSVSFTQSPALSEMFDWNDDLINLDWSDLLTLLDETSFDKVDVQDSNRNNDNL
ncbi:agamous-like MADS-box protein AGL80 [Solanum pennellii]|uniref:Agamous-like MADS-box protein AGL80 n=1 Tax=Solanum pennellii TaxID=28526 RepID=A0ABM1GBE4_SOLPN|nr:agamous-like MADS-box protein AGL80 [Solanum pennellii]